MMSNESFGGVFNLNLLSPVKKLTGFLLFNLLSSIVVLVLLAIN